MLANEKEKKNNKTKQGVGNANKFLSSTIGILVTMSFLRKIEKRKKASEKTPERASTESVNTGGKIYIRLNFFGTKINLVIFIPLKIINGQVRKETLSLFYLDHHETMQVPTELGIVDVRAIREKTTDAKDRGTYVKWKDEDRFIIGDYARKNGNSAALRKFRSRFPGLKESTIRSFKARVVKEVKDASKEKRSVLQSLRKYSLRTGRPLMLGETDQMVQTYIKAVSSRGVLVTRTLANAAAKALMARYPNFVGNIDVDSSSWAKSLFKRMGFVRRKKTSSKVSIPDGARKEIEFLFHHEIVRLIEEHDIPCSLIINIDQTPLKYVPTGNFTLAAKGSTTVTMEGGNDKRCITGTFGITFTNKFLPIQQIYGGNTEQSLPRFKFPEGFSTSVNPTNYSNATESIKLIEEIIVLYLKEEKRSLA